MLRDHSQITQCAVCVHMPTHPSVFAVRMDHIIHTWNAAASGVDISNHLIVYSNITQLLDCSIYTTVLYGMGRAAPLHEKCCQNGALGKYNLSQGCSMCMGWVVWAIYPMLYNRTGWSSQWAGLEVGVVPHVPPPFQWVAPQGAQKLSSPSTSQSAGITTREALVRSGEEFLCATSLHPCVGMRATQTFAPVFRTKNEGEYCTQLKLEGEF